jgi:hypothetical protein
MKEYAIAENQGRLGVWVSERAQSMHQKGQCAWA